MIFVQELITVDDFQNGVAKPVEKLKVPRTKKFHLKARTGCMTCRKRRVKCSEEKPRCGRCRKSQIICQWSDSAEEEVLLPSTNVDTWLVTSATDFQSQAVSREASYPTDEQESESYGPGNLYPHPRCIGTWKNVYGDQFVGGFVSKWFTSNSASQLKDMATTRNCWATDMLTLNAAGEVYCDNDALAFLSMATLASGENDVMLKREARNLYTDLLPRLQKEIKTLAKSPNQRLRKSLIRTSMACSMGEYLINSWAGCEVHLDGISAVIRTNKPNEVIDEELRHLIFAHARTWVGCNLMSRKDPKYPPKHVLAALRKQGNLSPVQESCLMGFEVLPILEAHRLTPRSKLDERHEELLERSSVLQARFETWRRDTVEGATGGLTGVKIKVAELVEAELMCSICLIYLAVQDLDIAVHIADITKVSASLDTLREELAILLAQIEEVAEPFTGVGDVNALLLPLDTCWVACVACDDYQISTVERLRAIARKMKHRGIAPFREPWEDAVISGLVKGKVLIDDHVGLMNMGS